MLEERHSRCVWRCDARYNLHQLPHTGPPGRLLLKLFRLGGRLCYNVRTMWIDINNLKESLTNQGGIGQLWEFSSGGLPAMAAFLPMAAWTSPHQAATSSPLMD